MDRQHESSAVGPLPPRAGAAEIQQGVRVAEILHPDWPRWTSWWSCRPAWQNSIGSITRRGDQTMLLGVLRDGDCLGYCAGVPPQGRLLQLAVQGEHRRRGLGTLLLRAFLDRVPADTPASIYNIDATDAESLAFLKAHGFDEIIRQHEMTRPV